MLSTLDEGTTAVTTGGQLSLEQMIAASQPFNPNAGYYGAATAAGQLSAFSQQPISSTGSTTTSSTYNFTQNNYSPKSLSRQDIYRQTKNQFAQFKERTV